MVKNLENYMKWFLDNNLVKNCFVVIQNNTIKTFYFLVYIQTLSDFFKNVSNGNAINKNVKDKNILTRITPK